MPTRCGVELIFDPMHDYLKRLFDDEELTEEEFKHLSSLNDQYWDIECPENNPCKANTCSFSKPMDWLEYRGYTSLNDFLSKLKEGKVPTSFDIFDANWARRPGHYNG